MAKLSLLGQFAAKYIGNALPIVNLSNFPAKQKRMQLNTRGMTASTGERKWA
jgi:hypothetical protein